MIIVEGVVLEEHDVRCDEDVLQLGMVYITQLYAAKCEEASPELRVKALGDDARGGEAAGDGSRIELVIEYATIEVGIVGRMKEVVEAATGEHEGKEGTRWGRGIIMVERKDDAVFHRVLKEEERGGHCVAEEERDEERADDIRDGGGMVFDKAASWTSRWERMRLRRAGQWCDVVWYSMVNLVRMTT